MNPEIILSLKDLNCASRALVGGKAWGLSWLARRGFNVPDSIVITSHFFLQVMSDLKLQGRLKSLTCKSDEQALTAARELRQLILETSAISLLQEALASKFHKNILAGPFAVRSSVSDEDGAHFSFAGQMDSFLNVTRENLSVKVLETFASSFSDRAVLYRRKRNLKFEFKMAVIIQPLINARVSGVAFSLNPTTGNRREILISSNYGLGEGVVSGECACDEFVVDLDKFERGDKINSVTSKIVKKETQVLSSASGGTNSAGVTESLQGKPSLNDSEIKRLTEALTEIASYMAVHADVEWGFEADNLLILQARPVTQVATARDGALLFDNSNIQESFCGVTTPLTFSFASQAYYDVYSQLMKVMGFSDSKIAQHTYRHHHMLGFCAGRIFYNIKNWYEGLLFLPSFGRNKEDMEKMMGLTEPVSFVQDQKLTFTQKLFKLPGMLLLFARLIFSFSQMKRFARKFESEFKINYSQFERGRLQFFSDVELPALGRKLRSQFLENWGTPLINDFYVMMMNGKTSRMLKKLGLQGEMPALMAVDHLASTEPTKVLLAIADDIREEPTVEQFILDKTFFEKPASENLEQIRVLSLKVWQKIADYIELYGDRCVGELKLESISLREDPAFVFTVLRSYLNRPDLTLDAFLKRESIFREQSEDIVTRAMLEKRGARAVKNFKKTLHRLRSAVGHREEMRLARTRVFGLFRSLYLEMGRRLALAGQIEDQRDIFFLTENEISDIFGGKAYLRSQKKLIALRKEEFAAHEFIEVPNHFEFQVPQNTVLPRATANDEVAGVLSGVGCYPGIVRSKIKLIKTPRYDDDLGGQILCTVRTDPGWTPLFASISGLVVERGSTLSHSAVVAREMGIPAIVGVSRVTEILSDGDLIEMDGSTGKLVEIPAEGPQV